MGLLHRLRNRLRGNDSLQDLHDVLKDWISELKFYKDELAFFALLEMRLYSKLHNASQAQEASRMRQELNVLMNDVDNLTTRANEHLRQLDNAIATNALPNDGGVRKDYLHVEDDLLTLESDIRKFKRSLYLNAEDLLRKEKFDKQLHTL